MASDFDSTHIDESEDSASARSNNSGGAAFVQLSRDRLIRRVISPRLWKNWLVATILIGTPLLIGIARMLGLLSRRSATEADQISSALSGLSGLELFFAAQLCLLICWVRAASAVDFRGGFRTWRWMSILLVGISGLLLTEASEPMMNGLAQSLQPLLGDIESARPALLLVPAFACLAFVLRYLIPDMGRCRHAQVLAVLAVTSAVARVVLEFRGPLVDMPGALSMLTAVASGLTVSSALLHCRYVIHVNPNPPIATIRQAKATEEASSLESTARRAVKESAKKADAEDALPNVIATVPAKETVKQQSEVPASASSATSVDETPQVEIETSSLEKTVAAKGDKKAKPSKKQLRKAG